MRRGFWNPGGGRPHLSAIVPTIREVGMEASEREVLARIIRGGRWAALATYGDGVPLASMVAYACESDFAGFLLHLSRLSAHTRNLLASPVTSLVIREPDSGRVRNPQTLARVS